MDFRSFSNSRSNDFANLNNNTSNNERVDEKKIEETVNRFKGKSEDELMREMLKEASRLKGEGKFDINEIESVFDRAKSVLSDAQLKKLRNLIDMLK